MYIISGGKVMNNSKVVIIGDGMVGSSIAYTFLLNETVKDIVIIDVNKEKAEGDVLDMRHGLPFVSPKNIISGDYKDIKDAHIVIITAGVAQKEGETRSELLGRNIKIFDSIVENMKPYLSDDAIILVVTNPVDVLSYFVYKKLNIHHSRVIGSGTVLDTARLKSSIASHIGIDSRNVHTYVLGEHGDSEVAAYSVTTVGGLPLDKYCLNCGKCKDKNLELNKLHEEVKNAAYEIINKKGATYYAVALAVNQIVKAIINDYHSILTVSTLIENEFDGKVKDIYFSLPCIVSSKGVNKILRPQYSEDEINKLILSGNKIKNEIKEIM